MKKQFISAITAAANVLGVLAVSGIPVSAEDSGTVKSRIHNYERYYSDYCDANTYCTLKEFRTGNFAKEGSMFDGCDKYTYASVEAFEGMPTYENKYDYIIASDDIIGDWFSYKNSPSFKKHYDVKLPLETQREFSMETLETVDTHTYRMDIMWKKVPTIHIKADSDIQSACDLDELLAIFPDMKHISCGKDKDGNYNFILSTGSAETNFNECEYEVDTILTENDAKTVFGLCNEHLVSLKYISEYEIQPVYFGEYPVYSEDNVGKAADVFEKHGISVSIVKTLSNATEIVPDTKIPADEYYSIISEINAEHGILPAFRMYDDACAMVDVSVEMLNMVHGDANCDGELTIADAALILQHIGNPDKYSLSMQSKFNADVVGDDGISAADALAIQQFEAGVIDSF